MTTNVIEVYGNDVVALNNGATNVSNSIMIDPKLTNIGYLRNLIRPRAEGKKTLSFIQRLRAVKFFEALVEARILKESTTQRNLAIAHGSMVGTFLLMRLKESIDATFIYHGFNSSEWKYLVNHESTTSDMVIHVFANEIDEEVCGEYLELRSFIPNEHFEVPHYVREAIDLERDNMSVSERVNAMRAYIVGIVASTYVDLGIEKIFIVNANSLPSVNFLKGFERGMISYHDMDENHFSHKFSNSTSQLGVKIL